MLGFFLCGRDQNVLRTFFRSYVFPLYSAIRQKQSRCKLMSYECSGFRVETIFKGINKNIEARVLVKAKQETIKCNLNVK